MFCPRCGQEQISNETRFCSRCGFLMTGVGLLVAGNGNTDIIAPRPPKIDSPRKRGLKQGLFIFLLTFLVVPIITILTVWMHAEPFAVVISSILLFVGGLLRMAYAWMFESPAANDKALEEYPYGALPNLPHSPQNQNALPPQQSVPASSYIPPGNWRDTNDLQPSSVTDPTTKLLQKEK
jgi:hypothetical protein